MFASEPGLTSQVRSQLPVSFGCGSDQPFFVFGAEKRQGHLHAAFFESGDQRLAICIVVQTAERSLRLA
jgi:hypothetical protein